MFISVDSSNSNSNKKIPRRIALLYMNSYIFHYYEYYFLIIVVGFQTVVL